MSVLLHVRLSDDVSEWVRQQATESGESINKTVDVILDAAKRRGWRVVGSGPQIREPE